MIDGMAIMISIQPEWCGLILDGRKTDEVRKTTPGALTPFKAYIYCTKGGDKTLLKLIYGKDYRKMVGKVVGEFVCDRFTCIQIRKDRDEDGIHIGNTAFLRTCLTDRQLLNYLAGAKADKDEFDVHGWAWHISLLKVYKEPKPISDFDNFRGSMKRPPQSWCYVREV